MSDKDKCGNLERCFYQASSTKLSLEIEEVKGVGNCTICITDEKNKECRGYFPMKVWRYYVHPKRNKIDSAIIWLKDLYRRSFK